MSNGRQIAAHNVSLFTAWVASKSDSDFRSMIHRGVLSRSMIAQECGFAKSALAQNPRIKLLLSELEAKLRADGTLPPTSDTMESEPPPAPPSATLGRRSPGNPEQDAHSSSDLATKLQRLQTENALQRAEIEELRRQLKQFTSIHEALGSTGRMPR